MNLPVRCGILKRVVMFLDFLFILLLAVGGISLVLTGKGLWLCLLSFGCHWASYELGYIVQSWIIRLELERNNREQRDGG